MAGATKIKNEPGRAPLYLGLFVLVLVAVGLLWRRSQRESAAGTVPEPDPTSTPTIPVTIPTTVVATAIPSTVPSDLPLEKGVVAELAELDKQFTDQADAAGWSKICVMHYSRNRLAYGKAACTRGLAASPSQAIRGELLYALGLIEEKAGNRDLAAIYFDRSLAAAPGSARVVENSLAELSGMRPPPRSSTISTGGPMIPNRLRAN